MKGLSAYIMLLFFTMTVRGQSDYQFEQITTREGLSQNTVLSIYQDKFGFMWFGTRDGLNQYDGKRFHIYNHSISDTNTLSNSHITHITEDYLGNLWVSSFNGLTKFNREKETFQRYFIPEATDESLVFCTAEDSRKTLWVCAREGLYYFDRENEILVPVHFPSSTHPNPGRLITCFLEDHLGALWFGTFSNGIFRYNPADSSVLVLDTKSQPALNHNRIEAITEDNEGNIWVGTYGGGINLWNRENNDVKFIVKDSDPEGLHNNLVRTLLKDHDGNIWIGTFDGMSIYDPAEGTFELFLDDNSSVNSLNNSSVRSLFQDRQGTVWIGTYFGGINIYNPDFQYLIPYLYSSDNKNSINYNVVSAIIEDQDRNLWIGAERGGLNFLNRQTNRFEYFLPAEDSKHELPMFTIKSLFLDNNNMLWIGTHRRGLYQFDINKKKFIPLNYGEDFPPALHNAIINLIYKDRNNYLWLCTESYGGIYKFDTRNKRFVHFATQSSVHQLIHNTGVRYIFQDDFGNFWVATKGKGIVIFNEETGYVDHFFHNPDDSYSLRSNHVYQITQDKEKYIWVSTYGAGIGLFNRVTRGFDFSYSTRGLLHDKVFGILEDRDGTLWISTNQGISRFNKQDTSFKNIDHTAGMPISELTEGAFHLGKFSGNLYFGGIDGLVELHPTKLISNNYLPPVVITGFRLFNQEVRVADQTGILSKSILYTNEITLKHNQSIFTIDFIALNFTRAGKNTYAFMLEGLEHSWNIVREQTSATYTLLNPGEYIFRVKAANNDGLWNEEPAVLKITVMPPPWKTWWAYILYVAIFLLILYYFRYFGLKREQLSNALVIKDLEQKKLNEINEAKIEFFANISHEFRAPLTLIIGPLNELMHNLRNKNGLRTKLTLIMQNAQLLNRLADQLMDFRKLDAGKISLKVAQNDWVKLTRQVASYFAGYAAYRKIVFGIRCKQKSVSGLVDSELIEKALFNIIINAFNNTGPNGKIKISISKEMYDVTPDNKYGRYKESIKTGNSMLSDTEVVIISVEDNGMGIHPKHLNRVFDKFYQVPDGVAAGTGIGLYLVRNIIELHHGCIEVWSEKNKGTIFRLAFPLDKAYYTGDEKIIEPAPLIEHLETPVAYPGEHHSPTENGPPQDAPVILIIERDPELSMYLDSFLKNRYRVVKTYSIREAQNSIIKETPDLILHDISDSVKRGMDFCRKLRRDRSFQAIPIILLSGDPSESSKIDGFSAGADDFFVKPFAPELLKERIRNLISSRTLKVRPLFEPYLHENTTVGNDEKLLIKINTLVRKMISNPKLSVTLLGRETGISRIQVYRKIKAMTGLTAVEYIRGIRLEEAANHLRQGKLNVNEIAEITGFRDVDYFRKHFRKKFGLTPTIFAKLEKEKRF